MEIVALLAFVAAFWFFLVKYVQKRDNTIQTERRRVISQFESLREKNEVSITPIMLYCLKGLTSDNKLMSVEYKTLTILTGELVTIQGEASIDGKIVFRFDHHNNSEEARMLNDILKTVINDNQPKTP